MRHGLLLVFLGGCAGSMDLSEEGLLLSFPVRERELIDSLATHFDHDPAEYDGLEQYICMDYLGRGLPHCYDGHVGTDFNLDGAFATMDAGSAAVLAAADGVVLDAEDGHYDRCHADIESVDVSCDGHPVKANYVILEHPDGWLTRYWHLMEGSVAVEVGETVQAGDVLGRVGSSGWSTSPHLHLGLVSTEDVDIDPYAGPESQEQSWWCDQGEAEGLPGDC